MASITDNIDFPDTITFKQFLKSAQPGDRYCYFTGDLRNFRYKAKKRFKGGKPDSDTAAVLNTADKAYEGAKAGMGHVYQERYHKHEFHYWYVKGGSDEQVELFDTDGCDLGRPKDAPAS